MNFYFDEMSTDQRVSIRFGIAIGQFFLLVSLKELSKDVENTGWMGITKVAPRIKSERKKSERKMS